MKLAGTVLAVTILAGSLWNSSIGFCPSSRLSNALVARSTATTSWSSSTSSNNNNNNNNNSPSSSSSTMPAAAMMVPMWFQKEISITAPSRGCHLISHEISKAVGDDLRKIDVGLCNLFVQHTSASLTINENADPDVRRDMEVALNKIVPAQWCRGMYCILCVSC